MNIYLSKILFATTLLLYPISVLLGSLDELNESEMQSIENGNLVIKEKHIESAPWPEITVWTVIETTSEKAVAIFSAYDKQSNYIPNVISSVPVKMVGPTDVHVAFQMYLPWPFKNSSYTTGNRLIRINDSTFAVEWYFVESDSTKDNRGTATFYGIKEGKTILEYKSFIIPQSIFAKLIKGKMVKGLTETVTAIRDHLNNTSRNDSSTSQYTNKMNQALAGNNIYNTVL